MKRFYFHLQNAPLHSTTNAIQTHSYCDQHRAPAMQSINQRKTSVSPNSLGAAHVERTNEMTAEERERCEMVCGTS